jgi:adenylate cyclase, class 2
MLRRNIELKARFPDLDRGRAIAVGLGAEPQADQHQIDTYFHCTHGRLKLREIAGSTAQLIWYARADRSAAKASDYTLIDVAQPALLTEALTRAYGQWRVVDKQRQIFLWRNVRIHLDRVARLGTFLEFEAVLGESDWDQQGHQQLGFLAGEFGLTQADLVEGSYSDLMPAPGATNEKRPPE